jgi:class 3 adenylate cyclase
MAFSGHMLDAPNRKEPRFPPIAVAEVKKRIERTLDELDTRIGYSSVACGSDTLFLECLQERGGETNIILPFDSQDFFRVSVNQAGKEWMDRVEKVIEKSTEVFQATPGRYNGDDDLFSYANRIIMGKTILRSRLLETDPVLLAVWDGKTKVFVGGTSEVVKLWQATSHPLRIIDLSTLKMKRQQDRSPLVKKVESPAPSKTPTKPPSVKRETYALLFADIVGYSKLKEEQIPWFMNGFLKTLSKRLKQFSCKPVFKNIWGDALYFVFKELVSAAEYALDLRDMVRETDWEMLNLPKELNMRIGLHAGPVYYGPEPILNKVNFFGSHVNQAARIEPITSPGNVYASEQFVALLMAENDTRFDCRYVGIVVLPKRFGSYPIYHLKRKSEIE